MKKIKQFISSDKWILILLAVYAFTRLWNLTLLPIFTDESIYIYWAKYIVTTHGHWFISLTDGKPPLLIWMISALLTFFPPSWYLLAGRLPSVAAGTFGLVILYLLTNELFNNKKMAFVTAMLLFISPFQLFYDRLALFDSLLSAMLLAATYFAVRTVRTMKVTDALLWGLFLGLAFLSKPTALLFVIITPFVAFLVWSRTRQKLGRFIVLVVGAIVVSEVINNLQRLSKVYDRMDLKNSQFQQPIAELIKNPFALTIGNMQGFLQWIIPYYTGPFFVIGLFALGFLLLRNFRLGLAILALWLVPMLGLATIGREIFPRYILFTTPYFLLPIAFLVVTLWSHQKRVVRIALVLISIIVILPQLAFSKAILFDPPSAPFPETELHQYITDHPSGYGLSKVFDFINKESATRHVNVVTQGTFGLYPYAFNLEYWDNNNVSVNGRWPLTIIDPDIATMSKTEPTFLIFKEFDELPTTLPVVPLLKAEKPGGHYPLFVTKLK